MELMDSKFRLKERLPVAVFPSLISMTGPSKVSLHSLSGSIFSNASPFASRASFSQPCCPFVPTSEPSGIIRKQNMLFSFLFGFRPILMKPQMSASLS
jgi:hypothetical protein